MPAEIIDDQFGLAPESLELRIPETRVRPRPVDANEGVARPVSFVIRFNVIGPDRRHRAPGAEETDEPIQNPTDRDATRPTCPAASPISTVARSDAH